MPVPAWLTKTVALVIAIGVAMLLLAGLFAWHEWSVAHTAKVETRLATGQTGAAQASGTDAVNTTGNVMGNEIAADAVTKENHDAIQNTQGALAPVAAPVRAAGLASLCRRASYRSDPKCMQHPPTH